MTVSNKGSWPSLISGPINPTRCDKSKCVAPKCSFRSRTAGLQTATTGTWTWTEKDVHICPVLTSLHLLQFQGTPADITLQRLAPSEACESTTQSWKKKETWIWDRVTLFCWFCSTGKKIESKWESRGSEVIIPQKSPESISALWEAHVHMKMYTCSYASIHIGYTRPRKIYGPMCGVSWAELICRLSLSHIHTRTKLSCALIHAGCPTVSLTHTHTVCARCEKDEQSWQSAPSSLSAAANSLYYATSALSQSPSSPPDFALCLFLHLFFLMLSPALSHLHLLGCFAQARRVRSLQAGDGALGSDLCLPVVDVSVLYQYDSVSWSSLCWKVKSCRRVYFICRIGHIRREGLLGFTNFWSSVSCGHLRNCSFIAFTFVSRLTTKTLNKIND